MTTRRTFLRVLGSAAVGAAVVPAFAPREIPAGSYVPGEPFFVGAPYNGPGRPITLEMLEHAYQSCVAGAERPMVGIISQSTARQLGLVYDIEIG